MQIYHCELHIRVITPQMNISAGTFAMCRRLRRERHTHTQSKQHAVCPRGLRFASVLKRMAAGCVMSVFATVVFSRLSNEVYGTYPRQD